MRTMQAIFVKQALDMMKNRATLIQIVVFPLLAFALTELIAKPDATIPDGMFVTMFASIFAGMLLLMMTAGCIAEDREHKSLRFLVMAGVKPHEYLIGSSGVILLTGGVVSVVFGLLGGLSAGDFGRFWAIMMLCSAASMLFGALIGLLVNNQQAAIAIAMPVAMVLGFAPMFAQFNETVHRVLGGLYTLQMDAVLNGTTSSLGHPFMIAAANGVVLLALFIVVYKRKGLRN